MIKEVNELLTSRKLPEIPELIDYKGLKAYKEAFASWKHRVLPVLPHSDRVKVMEVLAEYYNINE